MRISNSISHKIYILDFLLSLLLVFNFATLLDLFLLFSDFFFFWGSELVDLQLETAKCFSLTLNSLFFMQPYNLVGFG